MTLKTWNTEIENVLQNIRSNCIVLAEYNRKRYYHFKSFSKYFQIPLIILSSINASASVSLQPFLAQTYISLINCALSMICGIITSVELYLSIQNSMEIHLKMSKQFYSLGVLIYKQLELQVENRTEDGVSFVNSITQEYLKLYEESKALNKSFKNDRLCDIAPITVGSSLSSTEDLMSV